MFRIFQEILTNVARHARATRVDIELALRDSEVLLDVVDNGVGIQDTDLTGRKSLGLLGMQERALLFGGDVKITGSPGHGTRVSVNIPLSRKAVSKVLIADDHPVVRQGLRQMLAVGPDFTVAAARRATARKWSSRARALGSGGARRQHARQERPGFIKELRQRYPGGRCSC